MMVRPGKRGQIMLAAEKLFSSRRFHESTLDDIVRAAHVGKGTIYTYFKDKDDLFFHVITSGFDELCELLERRVSGDAPFVEQLRQACAAIGAFFKPRRRLFRMMQADSLRMPWCQGTAHKLWQEKRRRLVKAMGVILRKGQLEGKVRADVPAPTMASFFLGILRTRARDRGQDRKTIGDEALVDLFLHGAQPSGPAGRRPAHRSAAE